MVNTRTRYILSMIDLPLNDHFVAWVVKEAGFPQSEKEVGILVDQLTLELGLMVVERCSYKFSPSGITYVAILSQSHLVIHTWPESKLLHVDIASCKTISESHLRRVLGNLFAPKNLYVSKINLGVSFDKLGEQP